MNRDGQRGAVAVIVALLMGVLLPVAALVVDIGYTVVVKHRLRNLVDAAALAGSRQLGWSSESAPLASVANQAQVQAVAQDIVKKNQIGSQPATVQVLIGTWNIGTRTFVGGAASPNAVAVSGRMVVPTFFGGVVGVSTIPVSASATAALTPLGRLSAGTLSLPMGIDQAWFAGASWENKSFTIGSTNSSGKDKDKGKGKDEDKGNNKSNADGDDEEDDDKGKNKDKKKDKDQNGGCIGWTTFTTSPATTSQVETVLEQVKKGTYVAPAAVAGQSAFQFTGEDIGDAFADLQSLYDARKDPKTGQWSTVVAVYKKNECAAPKGSVAVVGFATVVITKQKDALKAIVSKNAVQLGRGGGTQDFGTLGSLPGLVN